MYMLYSRIVYIITVCSASYDDNVDMSSALHVLGISKRRANSTMIDCSAAF